MADTTKKTEKKEEMVTIRLPRIKDKPTEFVSINEKTWMIQRGVPVEVPACVAAQLADQEAMLATIDQFEEANAK